MAGVVSVLLAPLVDRLVPRALAALAESGATEERRELEGELRFLDLQAKIAGEYLEDAERKQLEDAAVRAWLQQLKDAVCDAEDLLDEYVADAALLQIGEDDPRNPKIGFKNMLDNIKCINTNIKRLLGMNDDLGMQKLEAQIKAYRSGLRGSESTSVADVYIIGRDDVKKQIARLLTSDEAELSSTELRVLCIVGMGGVGKTALAQLVLHDDDVKNHFDLTIWVWVSQDFDPLKILRCIINEAEGQTRRDHSLESLPNLCRKVQTAVQDKKFLLVLDDTWNADYNLWEQVLDPLRSGNKGSKVIVTTRSHRVAESIDGHMDPITLQGLDDECIWRVLENSAFGGPADPTKHLHLIEIGKEIAKKLKGSPLAAKATGELLKTEHGIAHWKRMSTSELWELDDQSEHGIFLSLTSSYHNLSPYLKQCFRFCSLFPKGYVLASKRKHPLRNIDDNLCYMWMAHDIFQAETDRSLEDRAREAIDDLLSMSLLQESEGGFTTMHDLYHAVSDHVARDDHLRITNGVYPNNIPIKNVRHLSLLKLDRQRDYEMLEVILCRCEKLRTLSIRDIEYKGSTSCHNGVNKWLEKLTCLRVLDLSYCRIDELPDSISNLKHLRYLNIYHTSISKLPESLTSLYNLQFLDMHYCRGLSRLPDSIDNLRNLRYLNLNYTSISELPESLTSLHNLRVLRCYCAALSKLPNGTTNLVNLRILAANSHVIRTLKGIGRMTSLQKLREFPVDKMNDWGIEQLENMDMLGGGWSHRKGLYIKSLENVAGADEARKANLKWKVFLRTLILEWSDDNAVDGKVAEGVLEALQPSSDRLEFLAIASYNGSVFPSWLTTGYHLPNLKEIWLLNWKNCSDMLIEFPSSLLELTVSKFPLLSHLPLHNIPASLKRLYIDRCGVGDESLRACLSHFTSLQELSLRNCPCLHRPIEKDVVIGCTRRFLKKLELEGGNWGFCFNLEKQYGNSTWKLEIEHLEDFFSEEEGTSARRWAWELLLEITTSIPNLEIRGCDIELIDDLKNRVLL